MSLGVDMMLQRARQIEVKGQMVEDRRVTMQRKDTAVILKVKAGGQGQKVKAGGQGQKVKRIMVTVNAKVSMTAVVVLWEGRRNRKSTMIWTRGGERRI